MAFGDHDALAFGGGDKTAFPTGAPPPTMKADFGAGDSLAFGDQDAAAFPIDGDAASDDSWLDLGRKVIENAPEMFKESIGGAIRWWGENAPAARIGAGLRALERIDAMPPEERSSEQVMTAFNEEIANNPGVLFGGKLYEEAQAELKANKPDIDPESLKGYAYDIAQGIVQMGPALTASIVTRSPAAGITIIGGQVGGQRYAQSRAEGRTPKQARQDAAFYALAEALPEYIPLHILTKPGGKFLSRVLKAAGAEAIQEPITQALQMGYDVGVLDREMTWGEAWAELKRAAIVGAGVGGGLGAVAHPFAGRDEGAPPAPQPMLLEGPQPSPPPDFSDQDVPAFPQLPPPPAGAPPMLLEGPQPSGATATHGEDFTMRGEAEPQRALPSPQMLTPEGFQPGPGFIAEEPGARPPRGVKRTRGQPFRPLDVKGDPPDQTGLTEGTDDRGTQEGLARDQREGQEPGRPVPVESAGAEAAGAGGILQEEEGPQRDVAARPETQRDAGAVEAPAYEDFRALLPPDEDGEPDVAGVGLRLLKEVNDGKATPWARLDDGQKRRVLAMAAEASATGRRTPETPIETQEPVPGPQAPGQPESPTHRAPTQEKAPPTTHVAGFGTAKQQRGILTRTRAALENLYPGRARVAKQDRRWTLRIDEGTVEENAAAEAEVARQTQLAVGRSQKARERGGPKFGPQSLAEYLARKGGLKDNRGELRAMDAHLWHKQKPGRPLLVKDDGLSLDDATLAAWEAGYFPGFDERPTINDLLEALDLDFRSSGLFTLDDAEARREEAAAEQSVEREAEAMDDIRAAAEGIGETIDDAEAREILAVMVAENVDAESAVELYAERLAIRDADALFEGTQNDAYAVDEDIPELGFETGPRDAAEEAGARQSGPEREPGAARPGEEVRPAPAQDRREEAPESGERLTPTFEEGLRETRFTRTPAVVGPDGRAYRIKRDGEGYIAMRMPREPGEMPHYFRPPTGTTWTEEQAVARVIEEARPTEQTDQGEQQIIPGAERSARQAAQARESEGKGRIRVKAEQKDADEGLFAPPDTQEDMFAAERDEGEKFSLARDATLDPARAPASDDFPLNATGDVVAGDTIRFTEAVFGGSFRKPTYQGERTVEADVVRDSYGAAKQQHTFTLRVLRSEGVDALAPGTKTRRKGRNVYRNGTQRQRWADEDARKQATDEKHGRGDAARAARDERKGERFSLRPEFAEKADATADALRERLKQIGIADRVNVMVVDRLKSYQRGKMIGAEGSYMGRLIKISMAAPDQIKTLDHEIVHALKDMGLFKPAEWTTLERAAAADTERMAGIRELYKNQILSDKALIEEAVADMFADWAAGRSKIGGAIKRAFVRIKRFLKAIGQVLRGQGFKTTEDIFEDIERGDVGRRRGARGRFTADPNTGIDEPGPMGLSEKFAAAYHGSPHDFDDFSVEKIGTGEGAQSYGWGLYFAGKRSVAEYYRKALSRTPDNLPDDILEEYFKVGRTVTYRGREFVVQAFKWGGPLRFVAQIKAVNPKRKERPIGLVADPPIKDVEATLGRNLRGRLYKVDLAPAEDEYLYWDKPLSEQSEKVKTILNDMWLGHPEGHAHQTGEQIYKAAVNEYGGAEEASVALKENGIPGIKYLDQGSRKRGEGTHNYVIFDDSAVKIAEKYSLPRASDRDTPANRQNAAQGMIARGQPLDRAIRLPFDWFGGVDDKGQWKPGLKMFDAAEKRIKTARFDPEGRFAWMNGPLEAARVGLIDRYGLDPEYVKRERKLDMDKRDIAGRGVDVLTTLRDQNIKAEEARVLHAVLTGEEVADADMEKIALPVRQAIDQLGQEAVSLGLVSPESYERNRGTYLHRVYLKHELDQPAIAKWFSGFMGKRRKRILGDALKGRGLFLEVEPGRLMKDIAAFHDGARGAAVKGERFVILHKMANQEAFEAVAPAAPKVERRVFWPADKPIPDRFKDFTDKGTWEVRQAGKGKIVLWRDYTKAERTKMGEILDARYAIGKTFMLMSNDLATGRFYKDIAENEEWARTQEPGGKWVNAGEFRRLWHDPTVEWVKVPDANIPNTGGKKRWGALAGKYVRAEIWRDLNELDLMSRPNTWTTLLTQWKLNKALALDTQIPTPAGWTTMGAIKVGDRVFDERGQVCAVLEVKDVQHGRPCYRVEFSDGSSIVADKDHWWFTLMRGTGGVRTTAEILATLKERTRGDNNHSIPVAGALDLPDADLPIPPYAFGIWLGDGDASGPRVSIGGDDLEEIVRHLTDSGVQCTEPYKDKRHNVYTCTLQRKPGQCMRGHDDKHRNPRDCGKCERENKAFRAGGPAPSPIINPSMPDRLAAVDARGDKHVPAVYLRAAEGQRRELLMGLMDSDGCITEKGECVFTTTLPKLRDGFLELVRSLGYKPTVRPNQGKLNGVPKKPFWVIYFRAYAEDPVAKLARKVSRLKPRPAARQRSGTRQIVSITPVPSVPVRCIAVSSGSCLYLAGEGMVPTHNTARSPVVHLNNVMSNFVFMDLADVRAQDLVKGIHAYVKETDDFKEARENGAFGADIISQEIKRDILQPILDDIQVSMTGNPVTARLGIVGKVAEAIWDKAKAADRKMVDMYRLEDELFRMGMYMRRRALGESAEDAAQEARQQFLDYDIRAPWVNAARRTVLPFIAYTYRAAPVIARSLSIRPWKIAKYYLVAQAASALAYMMAPGDEDEERRSMREEESGYTWIGVPRMQRMPYRDAHGNPVFLDIRRWIPAGDIFDIGQAHGAFPIPAPLQFGGPLMIAMELMLNKSAFTGEDIVNDLTDAPADRMEKTGEFLWKSWMPSAAWIPGSWYWEKIGRALSGGTDARGRPYPVPEAVASSFGVKLKPRDVEEGFRWRAYEFDKARRALRAEERRLGRLRNRRIVSEESYREAIDDINAKRDRINREAERILPK